jgi:hypothetical protein
MVYLLQLAWIAARNEPAITGYLVDPHPKPIADVMYANRRLTELSRRPALDAVVSGQEQLIECGARRRRTLVVCERPDVE